MTTRAMNKNSLNRYCLLDSAVQLCRGSNNQQEPQLVSALQLAGSLFCTSAPQVLFAELLVILTDN